VLGGFEVTTVVVGEGLTVQALVEVEPEYAAVSAGVSVAVIVVLPVGRVVVVQVARPALKLVVEHSAVAPSVKDTVPTG
jgi:hypothetical protein